MKKKLIMRLSNNLGNQMFMYAAAYAFSKKLDRELFVDEETAYQKNIIHEYNLNIFNFSSKIAPSKLKFLGSYGYLRRKILKYSDNFKKNKNFYVEHKDINKKTFFKKDALSDNFKDLLFVEGHFETEKYFDDYAKDIKDEFTFRDTDSFKNNILYKDIKNSNSVCICVRQNRFSEKKRILTKDDNEKSLIFINEQINYIKKAIDMIKSKVTDPKFFLWSNGNIKLSNYFPNNEYTFVSTNKIGLDLFLMTQAKHFIVIPSSYNWWGAWLNKNENGIILRPSHDHFSNFSLNNENFWPSSWSIV